MELQKSELLLIEITQNGEIREFLHEKLDCWGHEHLNALKTNTFSQIQTLYGDLRDEYFEINDNEALNDALHIVVFDKIHEFIWPNIKTAFFEIDLGFLQKCRFLHDLHVSVEEFGADGDYDIPVSAAVVELSVLDMYKSPLEKVNCLIRTYDLIFAELKTALVLIISKYSEKENDIPIINNCDIFPILMMVIIKSKLHCMKSNLYYIKHLYPNLKSDHLVNNIYESFRTAFKKLQDFDITSLKLKKRKIIKDISPVEYIKITSICEVQEKKTLVDQENRRILSLISQSTDEDDV